MHEPGAVEEDKILQRLIFIVKWRQATTSFIWSVMLNNSDRAEYFTSSSSQMQGIP